MTKDEYEAWEAHPVTQIVRRYLLDEALAMRGDWAQGTNWNDAAKLQVQNFEDLAALDLESIETFYKAREENEQDKQYNGEDDVDDQRHGY